MRSPYLYKYGSDGSRSMRWAVQLGADAALMCDLDTMMPHCCLRFTCARILKHVQHNNSSNSSTSQSVAAPKA